MNASLTVYTLPNCVQCTMTKRALDAAELPSTVIDLSNDERAVNLVKELGHTSVPVGITEIASWSGFRPIRSPPSHPRASPIGWTNR